MGDDNTRDGGAIRHGALALQVKGVFSPPKGPVTDAVVEG